MKGIVKQSSHYKFFNTYESTLSFKNYWSSIEMSNKTAKNKRKTNNIIYLVKTAKES